MSLLIHLSQRWTRRTASAVVLTGLGLSGVAGCALNLSPGERLAASAREEQETKTPVTTSALSRVLRRQKEESAAPETEGQASSNSSTTVSRGRLFSAIVDRFPSRHNSDRDPFLESDIAVEEDQPQTAELGEASESHNDSLNRRSLVQTPAPQRSDEELWNMFSHDAAGAARPEQRDPTLAAHQPAPAQVDVESLPDWARPQSAGVAERPVVTPVQTASTAAVQPPVRNADGNPFAKLENEPSAAQHSAESGIAASARKGLRDLIAQTRTHEQSDIPQKARDTVLEGASFAPHDDASQVRPADAVGGMAHRPAAATRDPFGDPQSGPADSATVGGMSPFATGSVAGSTPWAQQSAPEASSPSAPPFSSERARPATPFPTAPEWRGVRANSPVSLAVVEQSQPAPTFEDPAGVRHADVADLPAAGRPGRLLPRSLPAQDPIFGSNEQTLALTVPSAEGPLLAPPASIAPLSIAPPPALDLTAPPVLAATDETHAHSRGYSGWIIGGALLAAGMWLFGFGNRRPARRQTTGEQK